jgi:acyl-CoA synthetase (AMP-forming)/AMP-acid ligase II
MTDEIQTVPALIRSLPKRFGERDAVLDRGRRISYPEFAAQVQQAAGALVAHGVEPGDRVCLWAPNRLEWMLIALGAQYLGAVLVPLNTRYRGPEAIDVLVRTRSRMLVVDQTFLSTDYVQLLRNPGQEQGDENPIPRLRTIVDLGGHSEHLSWNAFLAQADASSIDRAEALADQVRPDDVADILFTSGTTGRSKGAMAGHGQLLGMASGWADRARLSSADRYLIVNPFFHSFGYKAGYLASLLRGALIVPQSVFDPSAVLDLVERERITVLPGPPAIYQALLADPSRPDRDLSSLRLAVTGAAMVPQSLIRRIGAELQVDCTLTAYGLTEAAVVTMCTEDDTDQTVATTCGRPLDWAEIRIAPTESAAGESTEPSDGRWTGGPTGPGEVLIRGPYVMLGYLDDPDSTAAAIDDDGWLHTGDVGVLDDRGYLRITDRMTDMFTVGGFNVYPAELEQVITSHPAVQDCAVIGVPDDRLGEVGRAYVQLRPDSGLDADAVIAFCREQVANFKVPRSVVLVDALPRNAGGKVVKTQLRQQARTDQ